MIVFNTTYHIDDSVHDAVIEYFKKTFIPQAIQTGLLRDPHLFFVHAQYEETGKSYSLQFRAKDLNSLEQWMAEEGVAIQADLNRQFGEKACGFMTLLEEINL